MADPNSDKKDYRELPRDDKGDLKSPTVGTQTNPDTIKAQAALSPTGAAKPDTLQHAQSIGAAAAELADSKPNAVDKAMGVDNSAKDAIGTKAGPSSADDLKKAKARSPNAEGKAAPGGHWMNPYQIEGLMIDRLLSEIIINRLHRRRAEILAAVGEQIDISDVNSADMDGLWNSAINSLRRPKQDGGIL